MSSFSSPSTQQRLLQLLNAEMHTNFSNFDDALSAFESGTLPPVNVCGFRCDGSCATCLEADASLNAFFQAPSREVMAYAGDNEEMDEEMRHAQMMDEIDQINRAYYWEYDPANYDDDYDGSYGLDWNDSGYFD